MKLSTNQSGIAHLALILIILILGVACFAGWRVYENSQPRQDTQANQIAGQQADNGNNLMALRPSEIYKLDLSNSNGADVKATSYEEFALNNHAGRQLKYDKSSGRFLVTQAGDTSAGTELEVHTYSIDGTRIYRWESGDAGVAIDTYLIDLSNGEILQITFSYTLRGVDPGGGLMEEEWKAHRTKDLTAVKSFKFQ